MVGVEQDDSHPRFSFNVGVVFRSRWAFCWSISIMVLLLGPTLVCVFTVAGLMIWNCLMIYDILVWVEFFHKIVFLWPKVFSPESCILLAVIPSGILDLALTRCWVWIRAMTEEMSLLRMTSFWRRLCRRFWLRGWIRWYCLMLFFFFSWSGWWWKMKHEMRLLKITSFWRRPYNRFCLRGILMRRDQVA